MGIHWGQVIKTDFDARNQSVKKIHNAADVLPALNLACTMINTMSEIITDMAVNQKDCKATIDALQHQVADISKLNSKIIQDNTSM